MTRKLKILSLIFISVLIFCSCVFANKVETKATTSLNERVIAKILIDTNSIRDKIKNIDFTKVKPTEFYFCDDALILDNNYTAETIYVKYISPDSRPFNIILYPSLIDKSLIKKGIKPGSLLIRTAEPDKDYAPALYYIIGYIENGHKDGIYTFLQEDESLSDFYGGLEREAFRAKYLILK